MKKARAQKSPATVPLTQVVQADSTGDGYEPVEHNKPSRGQTLD